MRNILIVLILILFTTNSVEASTAIRVKRAVRINKKVSALSPVVDSRNAVLKSTPRSDSTDLHVPVADLSWEDMKLIAVKVARKHDIHPAVLVGMTTLESGRGKSYLCVTRNNCGGIGAYDSSPDSAFHFKSYYEYVDYLAKMLSGGRYAKAYEVRHDPYAMVREIKAAGYASSPTYVEKVTSLPEFKDYIY